MYTNLMKNIRFLLKNYLRFILSLGDSLFYLIQLRDLFRKHPNFYIIIFGPLKRIDTLTSVSRKYFELGEKYNFIYLRKQMIFSTLFMFFFNLLSKFKNYKIIKIISDEKEKYGEWDFSLEWNNVDGIKGKREKAIFTVDDVTLSKKNQPLKLFLPTISENKLVRNNFQPIHPIYIGSIGMMSINQVSISEANADSLIYDKTDFIKYKNINKFINGRWRSRLYFVNELRKYYGDWFELRGIGWDKYKIDFKSISYKKRIINKKYLNSGICVDFLSQNSNNCLYERSINIINSGGILIQRKSYNSEDVFGIDFVNKFCFSNVKELIQKINNISALGYEESKNAMKNGLINAKKYQSAHNQNCINKCLEIIRNDNK